MNLLLGAVGAVALGLIGANLTEAPGGAQGFAVLALNYFLVINIFLALFNLLPIPPFDGSHIVEGLLPRSLAAQYAKFQQLGMLVIVLLVGVTWAFPEWGLLQRVVLPPVEWLLQKYYALAAAVASG
jgi:Zn-dependent protease